MKRIDRMQFQNLASRLKVGPGAAVVFMARAIVGCAGPQPIAYSDLKSAPRLRPTGAKDDNGRTPYAYSVPVNWRQYYKIIIEPVEVYHGQDAQFGKIPPRGQDALAQYMQDSFTRRLSHDFQVENGRASGGERECQDGEISGG